MSRGIVLGKQIVSICKNIDKDMLLLWQIGELERPQVKTVRHHEDDHLRSLTLSSCARKIAARVGEPAGDGGTNRFKRELSGRYANAKRDGLGRPGGYRELSCFRLSRLVVPDV